jgi:hypothetical protein
VERADSQLLPAAAKLPVLLQQVLPGAQTVLALQLPGRLGLTTLQVSVDVQVL